MLQPAFSREAMSPYVPRLASVADEVARAGRPGASIRLPHVLRYIIGEQISLAMANRPLGPLLDDVVLVASVSMGAGIGAYPGIAVYWPPYRRARTRLWAALHEIVVQHRAEEPGAGRAPDLIDILLAAKDLDGGPLSDHDVVVNAHMVFASTVLYTAPAVLTDGDADVLLAGVDGPQIISRLGRGDYFGEIGLLQNVRRTATVRARSPMTVLALERDAFLEMVAENDLTAGEINRLLRQRLMTPHLATVLPRLDREALGRLLPRVETFAFAPGATIVRQGDPAERFYIVMRGRVDVVNHHPGGDIVLATLGPGEYFGEIGLLQGQPRMATVRAADTDVEVLALDRAAFDALLSTTPRVGEDIGAVMAARLDANARS